MKGIIVLNYNTYDETIKCVNSIVTTYLEDDIKIYIIDNASTNESFVILSNSFKSSPNISVIKSDFNGGYSYGNNIGIKACIYDGIQYAIIANNDVIFIKDSILELFSYIESNHEVIIAGPRIIDINGDTQNSILIKKQSFISFLFQTRYLNRNRIKVKNENINVFSVSGCCFVADLTKMKLIGAFDESVFLYNEENILGSQVEKTDFKIVYLPSIRVIHAHGKTTGKQNMFVNTEFMKSSLYYWNKYRELRASQLLLIYIIYSFKWFIKSFYNFDLRRGWLNYFKKTLTILLEKSRKKSED